MAATMPVLAQYMILFLFMAFVSLVDKYIQQFYFSIFKNGDVRTG
jgi:hypothetical protein